MGGATTVAAVSAQGPLSPAFRIRTQVPREALAREGVDVRPLPLFTTSEAVDFAAAPALTKARILLGARARVARDLAALQADGVWIQRQVDMLPARTLERRAMGGRRVVLDVDDAVWNDTHPSAHGHPLAFLKDSARKVAWLARSADVVIAGNELLADWLAEHAAAQVQIVPSLVDTGAFVPRVHSERGHVVWGWIGSRSTVPHLHALAGALERAARELPDRRVELVVVGAEAPRVDGVQVRQVEWTEAAEREELARFDVGLMPLPDTVWTRGKCAYKALQYMAGAVPVVADDVGVSAEVIGHDHGGLIAAGADMWVESLVALSRDATLRTRLGAAGRERVVAGFSVDRWAPVLAGLLSGREQDGQAAVRRDIRPQPAHPW